jgi:GGDEF domain-containing protein
LDAAGPSRALEYKPPRTAADGLRSAFCAWLQDLDDLAEPWPAFDQLVREVLGRELGAARVRCYHVRAGDDALQPLARVGPASEAPGPDMRAGVLGHAVLTGHEFCTPDCGRFPLLQALAAEDPERWDWVWPVRSGSTTIGVVAVGQSSRPGALAAEARQALGELLTLCWQHVAAQLRLRVACRTDQASGVLTRSDFFTLAADALDQSYRCNEPAVVAVLALEGLRRLDDAGQWQVRDALIERIGRSLLRRLRSDDLVGRFADDRFALLLRRLDTGLGRLIADKLMEGAAACLADVVPESGARATRLRMGLVGSGAARPPLDSLLTSALAAVESARREGRALVTDLAPTRAAMGEVAI